jgi:hypothetical protein
MFVGRRSTKERLPFPRATGDRQTTAKQENNVFCHEELLPKLSRLLIWWSEPTQIKEQGFLGSYVTHFKAAVGGFGAGFGAAFAHRFLRKYVGQ